MGKLTKQLTINLQNADGSLLKNIIYDVTQIDTLFDGSGFGWGNGLFVLNKGFFSNTGGSNPPAIVNINQDSLLLPVIVYSFKLVPFYTQDMASPNNRTVGQNIFLSPYPADGYLPDTEGQNTYQWYKDGVAIPGETNINYSKPGCDLSDAGNYYLIAYNIPSDTYFTSNQVVVVVTE